MTEMLLTGERFTDAVHLERLRRAATEAGERGIDALVITPSPDYTYLLGYPAPALERLTCILIPASGTPTLVVPRLEEPLARHQLGSLADAMEIQAWDETEDPFRLVRAGLKGTALRVGIQDQMWARFVLRLRAALDPIELVEAGPSLSALRRIKSPEEIDRLRGAARAADEAMRTITGERLSGRSEAEVEPPHQGAADRRRPSDRGLRDRGVRPECGKPAPRGRRADHRCRRRCRAGYRGEPRRIRKRHLAHGVRGVPAR